MSYAHTKRRKTIAALKRKHGNHWRGHFNTMRFLIKRKQQGPCLGTLEDILKEEEITPGKLK